MNIKDTALKHREYLLSLIEYESKAQIDKWGIQDRHIFEWSMWTAEEFGEFIQAINEFNYERVHTTDAIIKEGIQTVTLILKMLDGLLSIEDGESQ